MSVMPSWRAPEHLNSYSDLSSDAVKLNEMLPSSFRLKTVCLYNDRQTGGFAPQRLRVRSEYKCSGQDTRLAAHQGRNVEEQNEERAMHFMVYNLENRRYNHSLSYERRCCLMALSREQLHRVIDHLPEEKLPAR